MANRNDDILNRICKLSKFKIKNINTPFICQECGNGFKRLRDLSFHITSTKNHVITNKQQKAQNVDLFNEYLKLQLINYSTIKNECWIWNGYVADGYGGYGNIAAHRLSYKLFVKEIGKNKLICHDCDTPLCINPKHLYEGTNQSNMDDMKNRGRSLKGNRNPSTREEVKVKLRKTWICISPEGIITETKNLKEFCEKNNINYRTMMEVGGGKGWQCKRKN